jgi:hypothetical protein
MIRCQQRGADGWYVLESSDLGAEVALEEKAERPQAERTEGGIEPERIDGRRGVASGCVPRRSVGRGWPTVVLFRDRGPWCEWGGDDPDVVRFEIREGGDERRGSRALDIPELDHDRAAVTGTERERLLAQPTYRRWVELAHE